MRHDPDDRPDPPTRIYHGCKDRMCGADDCPTCRPSTYDHPQNSDDREEQEQFEKYGKIKTSHDCPPIPDRSFDWSAVTDNYDLGHPIGHGATEEEAIADLNKQLDEEE